MTTIASICGILLAAASMWFGYYLLMPRDRD